MTENHYRITTYFSICILTALLAFACKKQAEPKLIKSAGPMLITSADPMVQLFYHANQQTLFWVSSESDMKNASEWLSEMRLAKSYGFDPFKNQIDELQLLFLNKKSIDKRLEAGIDQQMTGLVLNFLRDLQQGASTFDYDEVYVSRDSVYIDQLLQNAQNKLSVSTLIKSLESNDPDYWVLKNYLNDSLSSSDTLKYKLVLLALNYRKYLTVNAHPEYILVNIPETEARYYSKGLLSLSMRTVAGKKYTQTPTIASYITNIVTFPHWNVPHSIAVKEILPKVQKDEVYLDLNNLEVIDARGIPVSDSVLNWSTYTAKSFPYYFRQATGARNALGVLKFDLENPYSIFLHSSSRQSAFESKYRFLSHGCIRLENPIELAVNMLSGQLDVEELKRGQKDTVPKKFELKKKVPVFIIYSPVIVRNNSVAFLPDVYGLIK